METVKAYAGEKDWNMTSYIMEHHQRSFKGNGLIVSQMTDTFRMPKDFSMLVYLSMLLQAEGIRYGVEHWRRYKNRVSGILYWQLNDCWPVASWASLDYFGRWKALHYMARRFFAPLLLSVEDEGDRMSVWLTSDRPEALQGTVEWQLATLSGETLESGTVVVELAAQESKPVFTRDFELSFEKRRSVVFQCSLKQDDRVISRSVTPFAPNKHLELADPRLAVESEQDGGEMVLTLTSQSLARFVELKLAGADVVFSDNYFDVPAGLPVQVRCPLPGGWSLEQARGALQVTTLYHSF
jgi:beta-mannosidase